MSDESMDKCSVCGGEAVVLYPLLSGEPGFCSEHHNPRDAGPFGCDFTGPDDFDIPGPFDDERYLLVPEFSRGTFVWKDRTGTCHRLKDIDDTYLTNIINYLGRRIPELEEAMSAEYYTAVKTFLTKEAKQRGVVVFCG